MKITGQILKENRERRGISLGEVALATKINSKTLTAMEEGDLDRLPPKTFLRGFVRSYATYLGLDVDSLLSTFFEEMGTTKPNQTVIEDKGEPSQGGTDETTTPSKPYRSPVRPRPPGSEAGDAINPQASLPVKAGWVGGILLLVIAIFLFKSKMESYEKEMIVENVPQNIEALQKDASDAAPTLSDLGDGGGATASGALSAIQAPPSPTPTNVTVASTATPKPSATPTPKPTATPVPTPTPKPSATPTPKPTATPTPTPKPSATPTPTPKPSATPTPKPSPSPTASPTPVPTVKMQEVILEAMDAVDVEAQIDSEPSRKISLKADQVHSIKAKRKVVLRLSNGGAVNVIVNGVERGVPGDLGKPAKIEIP